MQGSTVVNPALDQRRMALKVANKNRIAGKEVCREIAAGVLSVRDALADPRSSSLPMYRVLGSQKGWGTVKVERFCRAMRISPGRRVRELTEREGQVLAQAVELRVYLRGWH